jgi:RNA polymerase sigma-70 factor (ECF subfamily)
MALTANDLSDLLARVARQDRQAFEQLYSATSAKLFGIVLRILVRRDLAEEILQDVYVKIWQRAGDFDRTRASPITWMATIARNRALDLVRRATPVSIDDAPEALDVPSDERGALDTVMLGEDVKRLMACLEQLEPDRREIVMLAYRDGLSRDAIASRFDKPVATIKTWLHRSLGALKRCLAS